MREMLFRGKRIDNGEWVEGYYVFDKLYDKDIIAVNEYTGGDGYIEPDYYLAFVDVEKETVCQFIQEVNKHRIFENDIVKAYKHGDLDTQPFIYPIEYRNGTYWFGNWTWLEFLNVMRYVEVVGNIKDKEV